MVLAVNAGNKNNKNGVILWMALTIVGGITFLGSQAWEWGHFIHGDKGAIELSDREIVHIVDENHKTFSLYDLMEVDKYDNSQHDFTISDLKNALVSKSNIFVMPSIIHNKSVEGFGIAYIEAAQYGIPSIGGKDGGRGKTNQWIAAGTGPLYKSFISSQYPKSIGTTNKISENPVVPTPDLSQLNEVVQKVDQVTQLNPEEMRKELMDLANEWKK